ncbi:MAG: restriction endonuclease subunit S [Saprospiraceae bacterium]|nr:restriction endonuclease subunit S [Saprospiraceae bacterium]
MSENWKTFKLGELLVSKNQGVNTTTEKVKYSESGIKVIRAKNISDYKIDFEDITYVNKSTFERVRSNCKPLKGDILYTNIGSQMGSAVIVPTTQEFMIAWNVLRMTPDKKKVNCTFLAYLFNENSKKTYIRNLNSSSTMPFVSGKVLEKIEFKIPELNEQKAIASILSALDDKIELNLQMNKTLEAMAMALYKHWFVDFGPFQDGEFVESELGEIPKGWEVKPLSAVTSKITDGAHHSPKSVKRGMPMASVKDMRAWNFNINTCRKISDEDYEKLINQGCKPMKNDVVIAKDGSYLKHAFVVEKDLDIVLLSSIAILKPNGLLDAQLLNLYLKLNSVKSRMKSIVSGAAIQRIVLKEFRKFLTIIPPIEIQNKALEEIDILIKKCWNNNSENQSLTKLRDTLLPKLISGEVRVKEAAEIISESM